MNRREIMNLDRAWVLDVLFYPRDPDTGEPLFPKERDEKPAEYFYDLAVRRGMPHEQAAAWARKRLGETGGLVKKRKK